MTPQKRSRRGAARSSLSLKEGWSTRLHVLGREPSWSRKKVLLPERVTSARMSAIYSSKEDQERLIGGVSILF